MPFCTTKRALPEAELVYFQKTSLQQVFKEILRTNTQQATPPTRIFS